MSGKTGQLTAPAASFVCLTLLAMGGISFAKENLPGVGFEQFTFATAYHAIIERSLRVNTQKLELEASQFRKLKQWSTFAPRVDLAYTDTTVGDLNYSRLGGAAITTKVNLFHSFGDLNGLRAADKNIEGNREKLLVERQNAEDDALNVLTIFIQRFEQREIAEKTVQLKADTARIAKERFDKGLLPMQEVAKVSIDLENARASLADSVSTETDARANLIVALGSDSVVAEWPWKDVIVGTVPLENVYLNLEARPDWRVALASVGEEHLKSQQVLGTLLPSFDFYGSYGSVDLSVPGRRDWEALWTVSMPLFTGFQDFANYKIQVVSEHEAEVRLETLKRQALAEIDNLRVNHSRARESAIAREKTAKITEQLYADNLRRFQMGRANANDLGIDLDRLLHSQLLEIDGWLNAHLTLEKLCHGSGGFISADGVCGSQPSNN